MIMGTRSALSMLAGSVIGFGILSPIAHAKGWAPGPIDNWITGGKGYEIYSLE